MPTNQSGFEEALRASGVGRASLLPVRNFIAPSEPLHAARGFIPQSLLDAVDALGFYVPATDTSAPFSRGPFFRPPGSHRSFYYCPALDGPGSGGGEVLAYKGLEPLTRDIDALLRDLKRPCYSPHAIAEHFVFVEDKIPACLGMQEALDEAGRACALQIAHLEAYGAPAHLPLPLAVFRHDEELCAHMAGKLRAILDHAAYRKIEPMLAAGLAVYVYYYPSPPIRARDADFMLRGLSFRRRLFTMMQEFRAPEQVIERWITGFARMLLLGFLPGALAALRSGACCQPQNACMDGGFVDLDSVTPFDALANDVSFFAGLQFGVDALAQTIRTFVAGAEDPTRPETAEVRIDLHYFRQFTLRALEAALAREQRPGMSLDPRVARYFSAPENFEALVARLLGYYPAEEELAPSGPEVNALTAKLLRIGRG
jgi:hypothetical protein